MAMKTDNERRVDAFHEAGHAVLTHALGVRIEYVQVDFIGGHVRHEGRIEDSPLVLIKAAGVIAGNYALPAPSAEDRSYADGGGAADLRDAHEIIRRLHAGDGEPTGDNFTRAEYQAWIQQHYQTHQRRVEIVLADPDYMTAVSGLGQRLCQDKPHFRDNNWKFSVQGEEAHDIIGRSVVFGSLNP